MTGLPHGARRDSRPAPIEQRLARRSIKDSSGCTLWCGSTNLKGYGQILWRGRLHPTHRVAYVLAHGEIAPGMLVCHRCDVRACINPDHLFVGSPLDNSYDMVAKGRAAASKLSIDQACAILRDQRTQRIIAAEYGVSQSLISHIKAGRNRRYIHAGKVSA